MADERPPQSQPGDGPYRTAPSSWRRRPAWIAWATGGAVGALALLVCLLWPTDEPRRATLGAIPPGLFSAIDRWPLPEPELPPATPLAPLLVADQPDSLAVTAPREGATRLRRGETLWVRFNRPMIAGTAVGRPAQSSPLVFDPPIEGEAQWTSRSTIQFVPAPGAWLPGVREARLTFAADTSSLSGEPLADELERVVVLDGAPRVLSHRSQGRVMAGAPLPLVFDAAVDLTALRSEVLAYEMGGGQRSVPLSLAAARTQPDEGFRVDVRLARALEPGVRVGIALAPRYLSWGGESPGVMRYELAPRPRIEGIDCQEGAAYASQCTYTDSPGAIVDIGPSLRLLASARVAEASATNVRVTPPLRELSVRLAPHGPPQQRLITIEGEWEPDQAYEVRIGGLRSEEGEPLRALPPLAVRSSGHAPAIAVASGRLAFERDAEPSIAFSAIHPGPSDVLHRSVPAGDELRALASPATFVRDGAQASPLAPMAPSARPNRWGRGELRWRSSDEAGDSMAVVSFRPDPSRRPADTAVAFVQQTDLGVTLRANAEGLLVWVTRISTAEPVRGARITVANAQGASIAEGTSDADGVARVALSSSPLVVTHAVRVTHGDDRAAVLLDPRRALTPSGMGLTPGASTASDAPIASIFTDRGAYRPGEGLHAKIVLRLVEGVRASAVREGRFVARLFAPSSNAAVAEREVRPSRYGTASIDLDLPRGAALGGWRLEVARHGRQEVLGQAEVRVAEFQQPTFRVDVSAVPGPVHAGDRVSADASATYLFGAPVTRGQLRWSLSRTGAATYPERWSRFTFVPVGGHSGGATVAEGESALGVSGALHIDAQVPPAAPSRTSFSLEVEVTDGAGHTHATRRTVVAYPAEIEVGVREGADWIETGRALELDAIAIDHAGEPAADRSMEARFVREGWHSWWEWSRASHGPRGGRYQLRRDQRREIVHRCTLTSGAEPVGCQHVPARPGTYVLEVELRDAAGRTSMASRRVYVAGPDEQPDRDPPGAPILVTPVRAAWTVGETAELAFESPFETAEALVSVEREGVLHLERRRVTSGGQIVRIPITEAMVPNAFVGVTLVRPRTGAPSERIDLHAPDLRFGVTELTVRPATSSLTLTLDVASSARPGDEVPVSVRVTDARGRPVRAEVALWAVDEGTLRLTGYQVPDPTRGLFRSRPAAFAWEDLRRTLVSRVELPGTPESSGDGGEGQGRRTLDDRARFDPTPLWAPALVTDAEGRASATMRLPERPTEYRVMAVAMDEGARSGRASGALRAEQPLVVRPALPRFLTAGDRFEAAVFVHNATDAPLDARVFATAGEERHPERTITIPARGEVRVAELLTAPDEGPLVLRFDARAAGEETAVRDEIPIVPRGRYVRSQVFVAAMGTRELAVGLPEGTPRLGAHTRVTVASHPFVGFEGALEALLGTTWGGAEPLASRLLGLCAYAGLELADGPGPEERAAQGRELATRLTALQSYDGGFGRWSPLDGSLPAETALAVQAIGCASERGWLSDPAVLERGRERLVALANGAAFGDHYGEAGLDATAFALRVLADLGAPQAERAGALVEQRDRLSPYGLAQLSMALGAGDARVDTLLLGAISQVLTDRDDETRDPTRIRWTEQSARVHGALLEAASRFEIAHGRTGELAGVLLALRGDWLSLPWGSPLETARALSGLAAYARLWQWEEGSAPRVLLDGTSMTAVATSRAGARFSLPIEGLRGEHRLRVIGASDAPIFFAIDGRFAVPLGEHDTVARGRRVALHRVYETPDGRRLEEGAIVPLGELVRVRLFVHTEESSPEIVALHDPVPAGFEAVDAGLDTTPRGALSALMGTGPDDEVVDGRAHHAMRAVHSIAQRMFATESTSFYFDRLPNGLAEYTYAIRASTVGEFTIPPAQIEALHDPAFLARSPVGRLIVTEPDPG